MWKKINKQQKHHQYATQIPFRQNTSEEKLSKMHTHKKHAYTLNFNRAKSRNKQSKQRKTVLDTSPLYSKVRIIVE